MKIVFYNYYITPTATVIKPFPQSDTLKNTSQPASVINITSISEDSLSGNELQITWFVIRYEWYPLLDIALSWLLILLYNLWIIAQYSDLHTLTWPKGFLINKLCIWSPLFSNYISVCSSRSLCQFHILLVKQPRQQWNPGQKWQVCCGPIGATAVSKIFPTAIGLWATCGLNAANNYVAFKCCSMRQKCSCVQSHYSMVVCGSSLDHYREGLSMLYQPLWKSILHFLL